MKSVLPLACALVVLATAASAQVPAGPEFLVNSYTTNDQKRPSLAMKGDGDFVVVWGGDATVGLTDSFGRQFTAAGVPLGGDFRINTYTTGFQGYPDVAVARKGEFVVVWQSGQGISSTTSIQGRRFDAAGTPSGGEFLVNSVTTGYRFKPGVAAFADGGFVTSWESWPDGIAARRFDSSGHPLGGEFVVATSLGALTPEVATDARGNFVVVWEASGDGWGSAIFGQRHDASGTRLGSAFQVNTYTTGNQSGPSIRASPTGEFVVAWSSQDGDGSGWGVLARRFDASGTPGGSDFVVNTYTTGDQGHQFGYPSVGVALDGLGNFVVTWSGPGAGGSGMFGQRYRPTGAPRGGEFNISLSFSREAHAAIAADPVGNFVVAWTDEGFPSNLDIHARRFGGLGPAALDVDSLGNHVLEPGETVDVRPSWRNFNGAAQTFGGTLANLTGPAGATYAITDSTGDYGAAADGAVAPCTDCYAVSVSIPAMRPPVHWDASAVESILPDTQGQQKRWLLHVGGSFADVPSTSPFYRFVETLLHNGVTGGCGLNRYCPSSSTTREQMAVLVLVAKEGAGYVPPACTTPVFTDVPANNPFCPWIEELARRGIVGGCGGGNYCPSSAVTREQMAVFVLRTLDPALSPPACTTPIYNDVPASSGFCRWIEDLTRRSVVSGCGGGNYCPTASVTREQMGVFISVTFGLTLYGP